MADPTPETLYRLEVTGEAEVIPGDSADNTTKED